MINAPAIPTLSLLFSVSLAGSVIAHEFTAALLVRGADVEGRLAEAVNGFLLAADERDGHPAETSDGHLGGVDVQILPLPREAAGDVRGLVGNPADRPDVIVVLGDTGSTPDLATFSRENSIVVGPGDLPPENVWRSANNVDSFAARFIKAFGSEPSLIAAQAYNAARRLDLAIRPQDGFANLRAIEADLEATESGISW